MTGPTAPQPPIPPGQVNPKVEDPEVTPKPAKGTPKNTPKATPRKKG